MVRAPPGILLTGELCSMALWQSSNQKATDYALMPSLQGISSSGSTNWPYPTHLLRVMDESAG